MNATFALEPKKSTDNLNILIIEDDISFREIWKLLIDLILENAHISWAFSASDGAHLIRMESQRHQEYDLVFSDLNTEEGLSGLDLWKKNSHGEALFIIISGISRREFNSLCTDMPEQPLFIEKAQSLIDLKNQIAHMIQQHGAH